VIGSTTSADRRRVERARGGAADDRLVRDPEPARHAAQALHDLRLATSTLFLCTYLTHKALVHGTTRRSRAKAPRAGLLPDPDLAHGARRRHRAARGRDAAPRPARDLARHKRLARVTLPIWLYVSVTGVVVWWMLYGGAFGPAARAS